MREIKFRGKDIDNGEWIYGYYVGTYKNLYQEHTASICKTNGMCFHVDHKTVTQYVGENDQNGREVYVGDIVSDYDEGPKYKIEYRRDPNPSFQAIDNNGECIGYYGHWTPSLMKVVGNEFDNPKIMWEDK